MQRPRDAPVPRPLCYLRSLLQLLGCYPTKGRLECTQTCLGLCDIADPLVSSYILGLDARLRRSIRERQRHFTLEILMDTCKSSGIVPT